VWRPTSAAAVTKLTFVREEPRVGIAISKDAISEPASVMPMHRHPDLLATPRMHEQRAAAPAGALLHEAFTRSGRLTQYYGMRNIVL